MTLSEFLLARIAEQEERCGALLGSLGRMSSTLVRRTLRVALAECEAKRRIVTLACAYSNEENRAGNLARDILGHLALPYADHPDYRQEWRP